MALQFFFVFKSLHFNIKFLSILTLKHLSGSFMAVVKPLGPLAINLAFSLHTSASSARGNYSCSPFILRIGSCPGSWIPTDQYLSNMPSLVIVGKPNYLKSHSSSSAKIALYKKVIRLKNGSSPFVGEPEIKCVITRKPMGICKLESKPMSRT